MQLALCQDSKEVALAMEYTGLIVTMVLTERCLGREHLSISTYATRDADSGTRGFEGPVEKVTEHKRGAHRLSVLVEAARASTEANIEYERLLGTSVRMVAGDRSREDRMTGQVAGERA